MGALGYELAFEERGIYLYACVAADDINFEMIIEYTNEIVRRLKAANHARLLFHSKTPLLESTECYEIASYIVRNALANRVKIAVVDSDPNNAVRRELIASISSTAGLDLKNFDSVEAGEAWLLTGTAGRSLGTH